MYCQNVTITPTTDVPESSCIVSRRMLPGEFATRVRQKPDAYFFVDDGHGNPVGIVATSEIPRHLDSRHLSERSRWMRTPLETAIRGHFSFGRQADSTTSSVSPDLSRGTLVSTDGTLIALVTEQDILIRWKSIETLIDHAQKDHVTELPKRDGRNRSFSTEPGVESVATC